MAMVTSQEANKLIRKLYEEIDSLEAQQRLNKDFVAANVEDKEKLRPKYNFIETQNAICTLEERIRGIKHSINVFNTTTNIRGMTIDQVLVFLPQLTRKRNILTSMRDVPEQMRKSVNGSIIDYTYRNYDTKDVVEELEAVDSLLTEFQNELDKVNVTVKFEIPD